MAICTVRNNAVRIVCWVCLVAAKVSFDEISICFGLRYCRIFYVPSWLAIVADAALFKSVKEPRNAAAISLATWYVHIAKEERWLLWLAILFAKCDWLRMLDMMICLNSVLYLMSHRRERSACVASNIVLYCLELTCYFQASMKLVYHGIVRTGLPVPGYVK